MGLVIKVIGKFRLRICLVICCFSCVMLFGFCLVSTSAQAQTVAEFFRQKKTQEKYLLKQLAYLKLYGSSLREGYELVGDGLTVVSGFTGGEFALHKVFFDSLAMVSPVVQQDYRVLEAAKLQLGIRSSFRELLAMPGLSEGVRAYVLEVRETVLGEAEDDLEELFAIVLSNRLEMNDKERLDRLSVVYLSMRSKANFMVSFSAKVKSLLLNKDAYVDDLQLLKSLYEKN